MRLSAFPRFLRRGLRRVLTFLRRTRSFLRRRYRWVLSGTAIVVAFAVGATFLVGYQKVHKIVAEIHHVPVPLSDLGNRPPVYSKDSENILIFGSDSRAGLDHHMQVLLHTGSDQGNNTDTIIVLHVSPGRHLVTAMSIPRDTMVPAYQCNAGGGYPGQAADPYSFERINSLLAVGGPSCLWKTVEQLTGIHIDHFIELGMAGFANVVNDVGGVNVCVPFNVNDSVSGLDLTEGEHHIDGITALEFWRTREDIGEGSDLQRIQRDQFMAAQVVKGVLSTGLLSNPFKLLQVAGDMAPYLTVDSKLSISDLVSLGESLHGLPAKNMLFVTAPVVTYPANANEVEFSQPAANALFSAIAHDTSLPQGTATASPSASASSPALAGNPAATPGAQAVVAVPDTATPSTTATASASTTPTPSATGTATPSATSTPNAVQSLSTSNGGITGAAACNADAAAFAGPNSPLSPDGRRSHVGDGLRQAAHRRDAALGQFGRVAGQVAVHPDRADAQPRRGQDVVHPTASHVNPRLGRGTGDRGESPEVPQVRLVAAHLLGRHHEVERHGQPRQRRGEQVVVAVRQDRELPAAGGQGRERRAGVIEHRHPRPRVHQRGLGPPGEWDACPPGREAQPLRQDLPVGQPGWSGFQDQFRLMVGRQQRSAVLPGDRGQRRPHSRIPVHDRAIAVERQPPVAGQSTPPPLSFRNPVFQEHCLSGALSFRSAACPSHGIPVARHPVVRHPRSTASPRGTPYWRVHLR
jgi:LCP family protein required for cell wall assembly